MSPSFTEPYYFLFLAAVIDSVLLLSLFSNSMYKHTFHVQYKAD